MHETVKKLMALKGAGLEDLLSSVSPATLETLLNGKRKPSGKTLSKILEALGVSTEEYLSVIDHYGERLKIKRLEKGLSLQSLL